MLAALVAPEPVLMPLPVLGCTAMCPAMLWLPAIPEVVPKFTWPLLLVPPLLPVVDETVVVLHCTFAVNYASLLTPCQS